MKHFIFVLIFASCNTLFAQRAEQREVIKSSMSKEDSIASAQFVQNYSKEKTKRIEDFLKSNPDTPKSYTKNNKTYFLYDITKDGKPRYITTKQITRKNRKCRILKPKSN